jgi:hypothetical protein
MPGKNKNPVFSMCFGFFSADSDKFYTTFTPIEKTKKALSDGQKADAAMLRRQPF